MSTERTYHQADAIHSEVKDGISKLGFYRNELMVWEQRIREVLARYTDRPVNTQGNTLLLNINDLHERGLALENDFMEEGRHLADELRIRGMLVELDLQPTKELHERLGYFQKDVREFRDTINDYVGKWL
ncbi:hypothetical protein KJS94_06045 [Flavihumibacter rivuli]|uniref:hypothetical protein n=1 Tax=Flavihumibacter rivuli TaxID=2838156 RepID=UPI001BDE726B|nr:hypothetical protein [Flavihumibacter rivuli]ULQ57758.1 hypothetical protein KJS94_06045 [Flavihumibacter rivuli]